MWSRSARNKETGLFTVEVTDWNGNSFFKGQFADMNEAEEAGQDAERRMTMAMQAAKRADEFDLMSIEDLGWELGLE